MPVAVDGLVPVPAMSLVHHLKPATPNIGNALIVSCLHHLVREVAGGPVDFLTRPARGTDAVIKKSGFCAANVYEFNQIGAGIVVGPGNLFENNALDLDPVALSALALRPLVFSVSMGRIYNADGQLVARSDAMPAARVIDLCKAACSVLVRDEATAGYLRGLGVDNARVIGCPVLVAPLAGMAGASDPRARDAVLLSVRHPDLMSVPPATRVQLAFDLRELIDGLRRRGVTKLALLCHDPRDISFAAGFTGVQILYTEDVPTYLAWLRDCRASIGWRLHAALPAMAMGRPAIHFNYDERAVSLLGTAGLAGYGIDYISPDRHNSAVKQALDMFERMDRGLVAPVPRGAWHQLGTVMRDELRSWIGQWRKA